jgi:hypothetical protein
MVLRAPTHNHRRSPANLVAGAVGEDVDMGKRQNVHGEGNYEATRKYNDATRRFIQSGKVEQAARDAEPTSDADALQMAAAEAEGKRRAKEEDSALKRRPKPRTPTKPDTPASTTAPESPEAPMPGEQE